MDDLELRAIQGKLVAPERACLAAAMRDPSRPQTERNKMGRVGLVDAQSRCGAGDCADYAREQRVFFDEIDRSDPNLLSAFAVWLSTQPSDEARVEAMTWASRALERKDVWRGQAYVQRVDQLLELRARVAYDRWMLASRDEKLRAAARDNAVEWMNNRVATGRDSAKAYELCTSVEGSVEPCDRRKMDLVVTTAVTVVTVPHGALLSVDGKPVGKAPTTLQLTTGPHAIKLEVAGATLEETIQVGSGRPTRWTWKAAESDWTGSF